MITDIVFIILSFVFSIIFLLLLITSGKYNSYIEPLKSKEYMLKEVYGVGFRIMEMGKLSFRSKAALALRQEVAILYGEKYCDYYVRVLYAQKLSLAFLCVVAFSILSCFVERSNRGILLGVGFVFAGVLYYYFSTLTSQKIQKRSQDFMSEFPNAVSTVALLVNSGMVLREAWGQVAMSSESELYQEMRRVNEDMNNGYSEMDALYKFANRCVCPEIKKFTSFIIQGLEKGSKDLEQALKNQTEELWEEKKQRVLQQGELAANKLLIPIMIMFLGVLLMIMGPIMTNLGI